MKDCVENNLNEGDLVALISNWNMHHWNADRLADKELMVLMCAIVVSYRNKTYLFQEFRSNTLLEIGDKLVVKISTDNQDVVALKNHLYSYWVNHRQKTAIGAKLNSGDLLSRYYVGNVEEAPVVYMGDYICVKRKTDEVRECSVYITVSSAFSTLKVTQITHSNRLCESIHDNLINGTLYLTDRGYLPSTMANKSNKFDGIDDAVFNGLTTKISYKCLCADGFTMGTKGSAKVEFSLARIATSTVIKGYRNYY